MDPRKKWWPQAVALLCCIVHPMLAEDFVPQDQAASRSFDSQLLVRLAPLDSSAKYPPVVTALGSGQDGKWLIAAGDDHALRIVQLSDGRTLETLKGHTDWVQAVAVVEDNRLILSCSKDCTLRLWFASEQWTSQILHKGNVALMAMAVDASSQYVACAGFGPDIWVYSLKDGSLVKTLTSECGDQRAIAFSSDGRRIACGGRDGVIRVWDWQSDQKPIEQALHHDRIRSISFSDDDTVISTVGEDRHFVRYQLNAGRVLIDRKTIGGRLLSMASVDSETIAVAGSDNTIRLIEVATGTEINRLVGHDGSVAVMVRSGDLLVSGSFDTTIRTWDLSRALKKSSGKYEHPVSARFQDSGAGEAVR
jgi:WD40 repeat protein